MGTLSFLPLVLCVATLLTQGIAAATEPSLVEQALVSMEAVDVDAWFFTETTVEDGTTSVRRHDPTLPEGQRWTLVSVDGREPTEAELEAESDGGRADADTPDEETPDDDDGEIRTMIDPGSLELIDETTTHAVYRFRPAAEDEDDAKFMKHVDGELRVNKDGPYVESVEMHSRKAFSAGFGVKIKEFATVLTFAPVGSDGVVLPGTVEIRVAGKAFLVKRIDENVRVTFSDYRHPEPRGVAEPR